jgi:hypothetical protein
MIAPQATFPQEFFDIAVAQGVAQTPPHSTENDVGLKVAPFTAGEIAHGMSPVIWGQRRPTPCTRSLAVFATEPGEHYPLDNHMSTMYCLL